MAMSLPRGVPEAEGLKTSGVQAFFDALEAQTDQIHSAMVLRRGRVVAEAWWAPYRADRKHQLFSLTKSFTSIAIGMAIDEGRLTLEDRVVDFFPDKAPQDPSEYLKALTIRHLLTMSTGLLHDSVSVCATETDGDWVHAFLHQEWLQAPGEPFVYDTAASHVLGVIVERVTGKDLALYLDRKLFRPLGITDYEWEKDRLGHRTGGYGLSLTTEGIARFGQFLLQEGLVDGEPLVSSSWIRQATSLQVSNAQWGPNENPEWRGGYGFQFWQSQHGYRGDGAFGQFCLVVPDAELVVVTTAGSRQMGSVPECAWAHLLTALSPEPLASEPEQNTRLNASLRNRSWSPLEGLSPVMGDGMERCYELEANPLSWKQVVVECKADGVRLDVTTSRGTHHLEAARGRWTESASSLFDIPMLRDPTVPVPSLAVACCFAWKSPTQMQLEVRMVETPFVLQLDLAFEGKWLRVEGEFNVSMGVSPRIERIAGVFRAPFSRLNRLGT